MCGTGAKDLTGDFCFQCVTFEDRAHRKNVSMFLERFSVEFSMSYVGLYNN